MQTIPRHAVVILPNRQRTEFEPAAMQELFESMSKCLMHAPVLREPTQVEMQTYPELFTVACAAVLVAGERRLRTIDDMADLGVPLIYNGAVVPAGQVPYVNLGELTMFEAEEAELDENLRRRDLTWQEHAAAVKRLHMLRVAQTDALRITHQNPETRPTGHTIADTAKELTGRSDGAFQDNVRKEILVAKYLEANDTNPAVAKAKSVDEAFKILKRDEVRKQNIAMASAMGESFTSASHTLLNMNCLDWMRDPANAGSIDVILTDPPYGMGADEFGDAGGKLSGIEHHYDDSYESWAELMSGWGERGGEPMKLHEGWCELSYKVAKDQAHAYVFCDIDRFHELKAMMTSAGWYVFRTPFIAVKPNSGRVPLPECGPRRQYEIILYAIKGKKPVTHIYPDVISTTADENTSHGAQKPVALYQNLLQRSVRPGDTVADFFVGSGTIFPAAHTMKCIAIGTEATQEYYAIAGKRLTDLDAQTELSL